MPDYGEIWTQRATTSKPWSGVAMSSDGSRQTAVEQSGSNSYIWTSTDYGATWTQQSGSGSRNWMGVAMSSDGKYQTATTFDSYIYTSSDYGVTWTQRDNQRSWRGVAMSSDGSKQTAVMLDGYIYTSNIDVSIGIGLALGCNW